MGADYIYAEVDLYNTQEEAIAAVNALTDLQVAEWTQDRWGDEPSAIFDDAADAKLTMIAYVNELFSVDGYRDVNVMTLGDEEGVRIGSGGMSYGDDPTTSFECIDAVVRMDESVTGNTNARRVLVGFDDLKRALMEPNADSRNNGYLDSLDHLEAEFRSENEIYTPA